MRRLAAAAMCACLLPLPAVAGDSSGLDTALLDQCLADAETVGARMDCAGAAQDSCLSYVEAEHPEVAPVDRQLNCLDAEWQFWEARLTETYDTLKATEEQRGADRAEALTEMERRWIAFRDARCGYDRITNGGGTGGATAEPLCRLNETARQVILLMGYQEDRT